MRSPDDIRCGCRAVRWQNVLRRYVQPRTYATWLAWYVFAHTHWLIDETWKGSLGEELHHSSGSRPHAFIKRLRVKAIVIRMIPMQSICKSSHTQSYWQNSMLRLPFKLHLISSLQRTQSRNKRFLCVLCPSVREDALIMRRSSLEGLLRNSMQCWWKAAPAPLYELFRNFAWFHFHRVRIHV